MAILLGLLVGSGSYFLLHSPEYALLKIKKDIQESGVEGIEPYLTGDAQSMYDTYQSVYETYLMVKDNPLVGALLQGVADAENIGILMEKISEVEWKMGDILKGNKQATVIIDVRYKSLFSGSIDVGMEYKEKKWWISDLGIRSFEIFSEEESDI